MLSAALTFALLLTLAPATAWVDDEPPFDLRYGMYWGGLHVADVSLRYASNGVSYRSALGIETVGLADALLRYRGTAASEGRRTPADRLQPEAYRFRDESRRSTSTSEVIFDSTTGAAVEVETTKRGEPRPMEVPRELWEGVVDPLSAFLRLRQELGALRRGEAAGQMVLPVFDGRRRYDLVALTKGRERTDMAGRTWDAVRLEVTIKPLAGFNENDLEKYGEEGMRLDALVSDDERLIPLQVRTRTALVNIVFNLREA